MPETQEQAPPTEKQKSDFFAAVRKRGVLNAMLEGPPREFERLHPTLRCKWEYGPPGGDNTLVVAREGMGFRLVQAEELGGTTESGQTTGPIRVGDLILMCAPSHIVEAIELEDARLAYEDWRAPKAAFEDSIRGLKVRLKDGSEQEIKPVGDVKVHQEVIGTMPDASGGSQFPTEK